MHIRNCCKGNRKDNRKVLRPFKGNHKGIRLKGNHTASQQSPSERAE